MRPFFSKDSHHSKNFNYPKYPQKRENEPREGKNVQLITNLMKLSFTNPLKKIYVYSIEILPELAADNFTLQTKIYKNIEQPLSTYFSKMSFAGLNLFASTSSPKDIITEKVTVEKTDYTITLKKVGSLEFNNIFDTDGINQKKKGFIEKLIKNILLSSKNTLKFGTDRMIIKMDQNNAMVSSNDSSRIYKGFYTSAQITESGLYMMVLNMNKYVSGKTMYDKIMEIRNQNKNAQESELRELIEDYITEHKTVLTSYGSMRAYRIQGIDFDKNPMNTSFNYKTNEGVNTISIFNYYEKQYKIKIKNKEQPLLIVEDKLNNKKLLSNEKNDTKSNIIYLIPELVYITGLETDQNSRGRRQEIISKTKTNPQQRMYEINKIHEMMNSKDAKEYTKKNGEKVINKSSLQLSEEWGIKLGDNLTLEGKLLIQPKLIFNNNVIVSPKNGLFRTESAYDGVAITRDNIMYLYDRRDKTDFRKILSLLFSKANMKKIDIRTNPNEVKSYGFDRTNSWKEIKYELDKIHFSSNLRMVLIFMNYNLQRYYSQLKEYLTNEIKVNSQFMDTKRLNDPKRAGSIMFNIVEQINVKMGGVNFYIDFKEKQILDDKIYLVIGLESKNVGKDQVDYVMTYTYNPKLNRTHTIPRTCKNNKEEKEKSLHEMLDEAIKGLREDGKAPHPPNYIIIYRQGGNHIQNLKIKSEELPIFLNFINNKKQLSSFQKQNTQLVFLCCNLKGELKFFEDAKDNKYQNPPSGLCVDEKIVQNKNKEFYIQPQFVNQGTATPCHFEILYKEDDNNFTLEKLENLSFQLSYYYWTWSGAVRVPAVLRLSTTAIDFYSRCLNHRLLLEEKKFLTPGFL